MIMEKIKYDEYLEFVEGFVAQRFKAPFILTKYQFDHCIKDCDDRLSALSKLLDLTMMMSNGHQNGVFSVIPVSSSNKRMFIAGNIIGVLMITLGLLNLMQLAYSMNFVLVGLIPASFLLMNGIGILMSVKQSKIRLGVK